MRNNCTFSRYRSQAKKDDRFIRLEDDQPRFSSRVEEDQPRFRSRVDENQPRFSSRVEEDQPRFSSRLEEDQPRFSNRVEEDQPRFSNRVEDQPRFSSQLKDEKSSHLDVLLEFAGEGLSVESGRKMLKEAKARPVRKRVKSFFLGSTNRQSLDRETGRESLQEPVRLVDVEVPKFSKMIKNRRLGFNQEPELAIRLSDVDVPRFSKMVKNRGLNFIPQDERVHPVEPHVDEVFRVEEEATNRRRGRARGGASPRNRGRARDNDREEQPRFNSFSENAKLSSNRPRPSKPRLTAIR